MKIQKLIIATAAAALLAPAAFAATTAKHATSCDAQMKAADSAFAANTNASAKAKELRAEGDKLCKEGKTTEGAKKLEEAAKAAKVK